MNEKIVNEKGKSGEMGGWMDALTSQDCSGGSDESDHFDSGIRSLLKRKQVVFGVS